MINADIFKKIISLKRSKEIIHNMGVEIKKNRSKKEDKFGFTSNRAGIVFSFDDSFRVKHWYDYGVGKKEGYKDIFGYYDIKATFNINGYHHFENERELNQNEIDMLLELQSHGHEIAHHGFRHRNAVKYCNTKGLNSWIEDDISFLMEWMAKQKHSKTEERFKCPMTFAFPGSNYNEELCEAIIPTYFKAARGHLKDDNLIPINHTGFSPSICIDENVFPNIKLIRPALNYAKETGKILVLMCHSILPKSSNWNKFGWGYDSEEAAKYRISPESIEYVINEAKKIGLQFYTMAEAAGVATFIDHNLELSIREKLGTQEKWIFIDALESIDELNLEGKGIVSLGGIEYIPNLQKLNLKNNNIKDLRLLNKLKKLTTLEI